MCGISRTFKTLQLNADVYFAVICTHSAHDDPSFQMTNKISC